MQCLVCIVSVVHLVGFAEVLNIFLNMPCLHVNYTVILREEEHCVLYSVLNVRKQFRLTGEATLYYTAHFIAKTVQSALQKIMVKVIKHKTPV